MAHKDIIYCIVKLLKYIHILESIRTFTGLEEKLKEAG